jgi:hypothetical protein
VPETYDSDNHDDDCDDDDIDGENEVERKQQQEHRTADTAECSDDSTQLPARVTTAEAALVRTLIQQKCCVVC